MRRAMIALLVTLLCTLLGGFSAEQAAVCAAEQAAAAGTLRAWAVDPHVKVFRDAPPPESAGAVVLRAARNEYEPGQIAFRADVPLEDVRIELTPLEHAGDAAKIDGGDFTWNFEGFIPVNHNTTFSERIRLREAPCEIPDPLLEVRSLDVAAGATQPVWLTVRVPAEGAPAGLYRGRVAVVAGPLRAEVPVELTVDPFALSDQRHLWVTNWFHADRIAKYHNVEPWSEPFWTVLGRYAENMAAHRQNVVYVPWRLVDVVREEDGSLKFDYGRFDRFVELFMRAGAGDRIEIQHVGSRRREGDFASDEFVPASVAALDRKSGRQVALGPEEGLVPLLADIQQHLAARGWLERSMIHVADEPTIENIASWRALSRLVHRAAPRLRRIDAIEATDFSGDLEVWVPKLSQYHAWRDAYNSHRDQGEFWYYICCHPYGSLYPNRFMDYPLARIRVLHWINFTEDLAGYLHWGLDSWRDDPFGPPLERYGPGDTHIVYPGKDGPLNSIRWEIQRESLEDYEYLHKLAEATAEQKAALGKSAGTLDPRRRALELARRVAPDVPDTETDPARIMAVRAEVADEIIALGQSPPMLVQTEPPEGQPLVEGPYSVEVRGATLPGAEVSVNGRKIPVRDDGFFACRARPRRDDGRIEIIASHGGHEKTAIRQFQVRR